MRLETGGTVQLDASASGIHILRLNRPEELNAMNEALIDDLAGALERVTVDETCRVLVLTGNGRAFCAGGDLATLEASRRADDPAAVTAPLLRRAAALVSAIRTLPQPVIAAVNGPAAGGGLALALAADTRICAASAHFSTGFVKVGLSGWEMGLSVLLTGAVGSTAAFELAATGRRFDAATALRLGLVLEVVEDPDGSGRAGLVERAAQIATDIAANSPAGVRATKAVMWRNHGQADLARVLDVEIEAQLSCTRTADHREALAALAERRPPVFTGE